MPAHSCVLVIESSVGGKIMYMYWSMSPTTLHRTGPLAHMDGQWVALLILGLVLDTLAFFVTIDHGALGIMRGQFQGQNVHK